MNNDKGKSLDHTKASNDHGALGENANKNRNVPNDTTIKKANKTSEGEGLNEERSAGTAGAFEGLEDAGQK